MTPPASAPRKPHLTAKRRRGLGIVAERMRSMADAPTKRDPCASWLLPLTPRERGDVKAALRWIDDCHAYHVSAHPLALTPAPGPAPAPAPCKEATP